MMIAAHHLKKSGHLVTVFHDSADVLSLLFEGVTILPHPPLNSLTAQLKEFDRILVENDNSVRAWHLFDQRTALPGLSFFFPTPSSQIGPSDYLFDPRLPVASNLSNGCALLLGTPHSKENDLSIPPNKTYRKYPKRVVIHPTSNDIKRNWKKPQFLELTKKLQEKGYEPVFCVAPSERGEWNAPPFANLKEVAAFIYESGYLIGNDSGLGHLASNLHIPTLTISGNPKRVRLWRPDWALNHVVTLPFPLPNFKGVNMRVRENFWQHFIPVARTLKAFSQLTQEYESSSRMF